MIQKLESSSASKQEKAKLLNKVSWAYYQSFSDSCFNYGHRAISFARNRKEYAQLTLAWLQMAEFERSEGNYSEAKQYLDKAAARLKKGQHGHLKGTYYWFMGNLEYSQRDNDKALGYYRKGLKASKELRPELYIRIAKVYLRNGEQQTAEKHLLKAASLAKELSDYEREISAYNNLGNLFARNQEYNKAKEHYDKSLQVAIDNKHLYGQSRAYLNIGNVYYLKGYWTTCGEYYIKSAAIKQKLGDSDGLAKLNNNIGAVYKEQGRYQKSIEYYKKSAAYYESVGDTSRLAETWINISVAQIFQKQPEKGEQRLRQTLLLLANKNAPGLILSVRLNLAFAKYEMQDYSHALEELDIANSIATTINDDHNLVYINNLYGACLFHQGKYQKAIEFYGLSLQGAENLGVFDEQTKALFGLYEAEAKRGNFEQSLTWLESYNAIKDSLFNLETANKLSELQEKYDTEQKEFEIKDLKSKNRTIALENELKTNQLKSSRLTVSIVLIGIFAISIFSFQRVRSQKMRLTHAKRRNAEEIRKIINDQETKTLETIVHTQENERKQLAKDLHDTLGSYLATLKYQHEANSPLPESVKSQQQHQVMTDLISSAHEELRSISHQMDTGQKVKFNLVAATEELVERIRATKKFTVDFYALIEADLPRAFELNVYKILQELFSNVLNHANASEVTLQLNQHESDLVLILEDDGVGFQNDGSPSSGIGIANVKERVDNINGKLEINSELNKGTSILIIAPIPKA